MTHKVRYSEAYAGSKFLFAVGTWDHLPRYLYRRALTGYISICRTPLNLGALNCRGGRESLVDVLVSVKKLPLHIVLIVARPRLLPIILVGAPPLVRLLLDFMWDKGWARLVRQDFGWIRQYFQTDDKSYGFDDDSWIRLARSNKREYLAIVAQAAASAKR
eukprot:9478956-Pyramimonas_sp.AAC.1